ncbi:MAG: hypothetical protein Q9200_005777 [Gallowayella weberi]
MTSIDSVIAGHTLAFFRNSTLLFERGLDYSKRSRGIFSVTVWGEKFYVLTTPDDVAAALKNTQSLIFHDYLIQLLINFGVAEESRRLLWHEAKPGDALYLPDDLIRPRQKSVSHLTEEAYRQQLLSGEKMESISKVFIDSVKDILQWNRLDFCARATFPDSHRRQISLKALCQYTMVDAATRAMFGPHLHTFEPDIVEHIVGLNDSAWMIIFRYPSVFASAVTVPRSKIMEAMKGYISLPEDQRSGQAWAIKTVLRAQAHVGIDLLNQAAIMMILLWAANSNGYNTAFWVLTHLLFDESLLRAAQAEVDAAWSGDTLNVKHLCAHSPTLDGSFAETLRINSGTTITRKVSNTTHIGGKVLEAGNTVVIPIRQLHTDQNVWGTDVDDFNAFRFAKNKGLHRHSSYRPFGGGATYCPGRILAKEEVFGFIAILLHRFRITLAKTGRGDGQEFPKLDHGSPGLGVGGPAQGMDVIVEMSPKDL